MIDQKLYGNTSLSDILKEVHVNQKQKNRQIETLISTLQPLIKNVNDASLIVPLIKEYLDISVKNDDHLIKLATVAQKIFAAVKQSNNSDEPILSAEEIRQIQSEIKGVKLE